MLSETVCLSLTERARLLHQTAAKLATEALTFAPRDRIETTVRNWLRRGGDQEDDMLEARATALAFDLALVQPSTSGSTAIDRLLRRRPSKADEQEACEALRRMRFCLARIRSEESRGILLLEDLACGAEIRLFDDDLRAIPGQAVALRLCPLPGAHGFISVSMITLLDDAGLAVAAGFIRPGGKGLSNPYRCAEAIYRHTLRHGGPGIVGIDTPSGGSGEFPYRPEDSELDGLAFAWAAAEPLANDLARARRLATADNLVEAVSTAAFARQLGREDLAVGYCRIASVLMETLQRRARSGWGGNTPSVEEIGRQIDRNVAEGQLQQTVRDLFDELLRQVRVRPAALPVDTDLDRLIQRLQALRNKTVEQGCTEEEALAAAEKVAELLDRYGLSLSELDLRRQACEGVGIQTDRRRSGPIDDCAPSIAAFFDCRAWIEKPPSGLLRHVFFGLPADVEAAHYLYDLIEIAFVTETERFKAGGVYASLHSGERRGGTNSFQIGLAHGIVGKLHKLREEREGVMRRAGRGNLVPVKASVVDDELDRLGIGFTVKKSRARRRVLSDAYGAGQTAADRFEIHPGLYHHQRRDG